MTESEQFDEWNEVKKSTHDSTRLPAIKEGEIWWCAIGKNIGVEINGKGAKFVRPILVYKKLYNFE